MDYTDMLDQHRRRLRHASLSDPQSWRALLAVARTAELASRDLGPATFDWAHHAVAVYDALTVLTRAGAAPNGLDETLLPVPPGDSPELRRATMRLSGAVARVYAEAAVGEPDLALRQAYTQVAATLTEAASRLRPPAEPGRRPRRRLGSPDGRRGLVSVKS